MTGTDYLLESLLRIAGVNVEDAKKMLGDMAKDYVDLVNRIKKIEQQQELLLVHFEITTSQPEEKPDANGSGQIQSSHI